MLATTAVLAVPASAQEADETPVREVAEQSTGSNQTVNVGVEVSGGYSDNVYATRNREENDLYLLVRPFARAEWGSGANRLTIRSEGSIKRPSN